VADHALSTYLAHFQLPPEPAQMQAAA